MLRDMSDSVFALVVTHNRKALLRECLEAIAKQQYPVAGIVVVNNASSDGTVEMLREEFPHVQLVDLPENTGAAGGFHHGLAYACEQGCEWIWLLDDDCIPYPDTLQKLIEGLKLVRTLGPEPTALFSRVVWKDGRIHPLNMPWPDLRHPRLLKKGLEYGQMLVRFGSYASMLVRAQAVEEHGLPIKEYFLWSDDVEYSGRLLRRGYGYWIFDSVLQHKTAHPNPPAGASGERFFLEVRNRIWLLRSNSYGVLGRLAWTFHFLAELVAYLWGTRGRGLSVVCRGMIAGFSEPPPRPQQPSPAFSDRP